MTGMAWQDLIAAVIALVALVWLVRRRWRAGRGGTTPRCEGCEGCATDAPPLASGEAILLAIGEPGESSGSLSR